MTNFLGKEALARRWAATWWDLRLTPAADLFENLCQRYNEAHRAYHSLEHIRDCQEQFTPLRSLANHPAEIELALWFHDAIYDTQRSDNEVLSADWAAEALCDAGAPKDISERIHNLIMATKHDARPAKGDPCLLVDIDLAILGAPADRFDRYEQQIRQEYSWVPESKFRAGRAKILQWFASQPRLYHCEPLYNAFEDQARINLQRSLHRLKS